MKKRLIAAFLTLVMLLSLTGCGNDQKALIGRWVADVDCTQALEDEITSSMDEDMLPYFKLSSFTMKMVFTCNEDGTYTMAVDEGSLQKTAEIFRRDLTDMMEAYLNDVVEAQGVSMDDFLSILGVSVEELLDEMLSDEDMDEMVQDMADSIYSTGKYLAKDGKLYLTDSTSSNMEEGIYDEYVLKNDVLVLVTSTVDMDPMVASLYPMTFHKA